MAKAGKFTHQKRKKKSDLGGGKKGTDLRKAREKRIVGLGYGKRWRGIENLFP